VLASGITLAIVAAGVIEAPKALQKFQKPGPEIPTARVRRGPVDMKIYATGELRSVQTAMLVAPPVSGGTLQIIHIVKTGTLVKAGDVVIEFDPVEQEYNLELSRSQLDEADQQIKKLQADIAVRTAADKVSLLVAQYDVRRAELQVQGNDLLGTIEARKNILNLEEARRRLDQMQKDIKSRESSDKADLAVQAVNRARAMMGMKLAQQNIDNMILRVPIDGIMVVAQNLMALYSGGAIMISSGMEIPDYREGDQANPGATLAQIRNVEQMEITSKVSETDRGSLETGQPVDIKLDALLLTDFTGKIKSLAGMASVSSQSVSDLFSSTRSFDASFELDSKGLRVTPGVSARVMISGKQVNDALSVPRQALFTKEGKQIVYVKRAEDWEAREIQIKYLTESRAVIDGLAEGTEVALVDPNLVKGKAGRKTGALSSILGGGGQ
jgi:multidrug efflux pump subunit AcrA (membrane-fusion protein)